MLLLALFALLAGAVTSVTPCVLPVLPALLSASGTGGRRRPFGIVAGHTVTFFITIVGLASVVDGVGLADGTTRTLAIVVLAGFGVALVWPALGHRLEDRVAGLSRLGPRDRGSGFWSGALVGAALGFVYAPCAGPILAAVISVSAAQDATAETLVVAAAYSLGSAITLLLIALGGRRALGRFGRGPGLQRAMGGVMVLTAVVMAAELDVRFQTALANDLPSVVANPTRALERSDAVEDRLADLRGRPKFEQARTPTLELPLLGAAPELAGTGRWFNSDPLTLGGLRARGRVVLIDFWTYTCINCIRTLPFLRALDARYRDRGLTIVGVHTPEFAFERDAGNVADAVRQNRLRYPVVQDNEYGTWQAFGNQYWPAKYLIDAQGQVRYVHFGEGEYEETEEAVRALLDEPGAGRTRAPVETALPGIETPETYLGAQRAERFLPGAPRLGTHRYRGHRGALPPSHFTLSGTWRTDAESSTAVRDARIHADFKASKVFLVLSSRGERPRELRVLLDSKRVRTVTVRKQRLYRLVELPRVERHRLTLELEPGLTGYAFTFG